MIALIKKAKSNKSSCQQCKKRIEAGEFRGVDKYNSFGHTKQKYFCAVCAKKVLELCKNAIEDMLLQLK